MPYLRKWSTSPVHAGPAVEIVKIYRIQAHLLHCLRDVTYRSSKKLYVSYEMFVVFFLRSHCIS